MFDAAAYLAVLGLDARPEPTLPTLRLLHKRHLAAIPYDSALNSGRGTGLWAGVDIDADHVFDELIRKGRGGVCYELNGLFRLLLADLGYETGVFAAGIRQLDGSFGPDLEHVFGFVRLDGELLLVDVGFVGPSYLEPLRVSSDVQHQYGSDFQIIEDGGYHVVRRRGRTGDWRPVYRFRPVPRALDEWRRDSPELEDFARRLASAGTLVRGRTFGNSQRILIGKRLLTVEDGHEQIRGVVKPADYHQVLTEILGAAR